MTIQRNPAGGKMKGLIDKKGKRGEGEGEGDMQEVLGKDDSGGGG